VSAITARGGANPNRVPRADPNKADPNKADPNKAPNVAPMAAAATVPPNSDGAIPNKPAARSMARSMAQSMAAASRHNAGASPSALAARD
jgi:hypothetical protein